MLATLPEHASLQQAAMLKSDHQSDTQMMAAPCDSPPSVVTLRMVAQGKEVGSIIGKKGDNVKKYREESGAKINISDSTCPERIVTLTGCVDQIYHAFQMILARFDEDLALPPQPNGLPTPHNIRLVIPASQCGSLIGKGGTKIKDIRESTGASVQVAGEMLPASTERAVTISGPNPAITNCIKEICTIMLESPPKGATIPYRPKPVIQSPLMYAAAAGAAAQAAYIAPNSQYLQALMAQNQLQGQAAAGLAAGTSLSGTPTTQQCSESQARHGQPSPLVSTASAGLNPSHQTSSQLAHVNPQTGTPLILSSPQTTPVVSAATIPAYGSYINQAMLGVSNLNSVNPYLGRPINNNYLAAVTSSASQQTPAPPQQTQTSELLIPNELIGCVIGRGGIKINEIRQMSGANIKISNCEEGSSDRKVTITGVPETISLAIYLINSSIELHKHQILSLDPTLAALVQATQGALAAQSSLTAGILPMAGMTPTALPPAKQLTVYPYTMASPYTNAMAYNSYNTTAAYNPVTFGLTQAFDPKTFLTQANKLKVLPTNGMIKQDHRFAPY